MIGIYFSGTGNTKHCIKQWIQEVDSSADCLSIEDSTVVSEITRHEQIVIAYPVYYSNLPKIVRDFIVENHGIFAGKRIYIIATMGLFSGDGSGCAARLFTQYGADIIGGLHLRMPDSIGDEKVLKRTKEQNRAIVKAAEAKIKIAAQGFVNGIPTQEGIGILPHMAGLFGQRLWFYHKTKNYSNKLKIDPDKCTGCGICVQLCPLNNISIIDKKAQPHGVCTMCYRCVSHCPKQAITLLGKQIYEQCRIENYL